MIPLTHPSSSSESLFTIIPIFLSFYLLLHPSNLLPLPSPYPLFLPLPTTSLTFFHFFFFPQPFNLIKIILILILLPSLITLKL
ncbi:SMR family transporter, partial [Staphylococcus saprophyticus]|uniref:SMR family transporter n=1 Tax=Staphylococcus saprophyticus TaxID=29385 RepID=UPI0028CB614D